MPKKKFNKRIVCELIWGGHIEGYLLVEAGDWEVDYKYQTQECILRDLSDNKCYLYLNTRSGSPFTDYYYGYTDAPDELELVEVELATKVVQYWAVVSNEGEK